MSNAKTDIFLNLLWISIVFCRFKNLHRWISVLCVTLSPVIIGNTRLANTDWVLQRVFKLQCTDDHRNLVSSIAHKIFSNVMLCC